MSEDKKDFERYFTLYIERCAENDKRRANNRERE